MHQGDVTATAVSRNNDLSFVRHQNMGSEFYTVFHSWLQPYLCILDIYWKLEHAAIHYNGYSAEKGATMFRKTTRVSLLTWFPETPIMCDALCTHNTTGFETNMCLVPTTHFAIYTQSEYIPTMPVHPEKALYTQ